jgi:hypothetical protein
MTYTAMSEKLFQCFWSVCYLSFVRRSGAVKNMQTSNISFFPHIIIEDPDTIVADPHHFDADSDPACHLHADPDPACHVDVIRILHFTLMRTVRSGFGS